MPLKLHDPWCVLGWKLKAAPGDQKPDVFKDDPLNPLELSLGELLLKWLHESTEVVLSHQSEKALSPLPLGEPDSISRCDVIVLIWQLLFCFHVERK